MSAPGKYIPPHARAVLLGEAAAPEISANNNDHSVTHTNGHKGGGGGGGGGFLSRNDDMPAAFASMSMNKDRGDRWGKGDGDRPPAWSGGGGGGGGGGYQGNGGGSSERFNEAAKGGWNPRSTPPAGGGSVGGRFGSHNVNDSDVEALFRGNHDSGINFDKYDNIPVEVSGPDPVKPIETYDNLSEIHEILRENIRRAGCA